MRKEKILEILENAKDGNGAVPMRLVRTAFDKLPEPCEDTISRQAAIDALENSSKPYVWQGAEIVRNLPSARPEPQWIPISDRLPRDGTWNIFTDGKNISVERYKADAIDHFFPNGRWFQLEDVIAWMPLPEPYKPKRKTKW